MHRGYSMVLEQDMEDKLIVQLTRGPSQWTLRDDIKTEDQLWANLRQHLNRINHHVLNGRPISDSEMERIRECIKEAGSSPYQAAQWLAGEHGIAQISLERDDLKKISLVAVNSRDIAGGGNCYELIHQYRSPKTGPDTRNRRFDVTLLINGLPLIHIELKRPGDGKYMDAFRQIKKYCNPADNKFQGIFGLVQMFVISNGTDTAYMAAARYDEFNERFLSHWVDEDNKPHEDYLDFAREVLNVTRAHEMIGRYSVIDQQRHRLILLRPYQIHAVEKIKEASERQQSGYIWHTTGSGKTLTAFNVTRNLLSIRSIDKVIFLIDRCDLDKQTRDSFEAYAGSINLAYRESKSTRLLCELLQSPDREAVITTVQKLQTLLRRCTNADAADKDIPAPGGRMNMRQFREHLKNLQVAFVVDECHRTVSANTQKIIKKFFNNPKHPSLWYGFTGTPIFAEKEISTKGALPQTTKEQYEECLHTYTIKDAVRDQSVLCFQVTNLGYGENLKIIARMQAGHNLNLEHNTRGNTDNEVACRQERDLEQYFEKRYGCSIYSTREHKRKVVKYIINECAAKFNLYAEKGRAYEAMLTCNSIQEAQEYYDLVQEFKSGTSTTCHIDESIKQLDPEFPKTAITYTVGENEEGAEVNQEKMQQSLHDYNRMFHTNYSLDTLKGYNNDLTARLARKSTGYNNRKQQLDLVIVVDRLLTGFDAPCLALLLIDRPPMKAHNIVQAMSRTNRIFDQTKRYGYIVTTRSPYQFSHAIDQALLQYSQGGIDVVSAPPYEEAAKKFKETVEKLYAMAPDPAEINLKAAADNWLRKFIKAVQKVDRCYAVVRTYDEFDETRVKSDFGFDPELFEQYLGKYHNAVEELKQRGGSNGGDGGDGGDGGTANPDPDPDPDVVDFDYKLCSVRETIVNYQYLTGLMQGFVPQDNYQSSVINTDDYEYINSLIKEYSKQNPKHAAVVEEVWRNLYTDPFSIKNKYIDQIIADRVQIIINAKIDEFAGRWSIDAEKVHFYADNQQNIDNIIPKYDLSFNFNAYKANGGSAKNIMEANQLIRGELKTLLADEIWPLKQQSRY